ncbi:MAG: carbohydrate kinase family protein [Nocardioidaceae bacterium]|nr:carbohydrate kinase family protein [Nocardioidaceae bacterium]NUS51094.1 carbohydrate kinase family protein [Nocardioidaceae bacterium]
MVDETGVPGSDVEFDVFLHGTVFLDIIFTGLPAPPTPGKEIWATGMGSSPGGIANLATAASRLGLRTSLAAAFGDDVYGEFCWRTLADQEGIDLSHSRSFEQWHSPVTVSIASEGDRSMVTHGHPPPVPPGEMIGRPPRSRAVLLDLDTGPETAGTSPDWVEHARRDGALVFADVGWDDTGQWSSRTLDQLSSCHAFLPNAAEAMAYTRTDTPRDALYALADRVPLAVVTNGVHGALAIDSATGEEAEVPSLRVSAIDPTGAGDVFGTAIVLGTLNGWPLAHRLAFAAVCSGLAVQQFGGSLAAPGLGDVLDWWQQVKAQHEPGAYAASLRRRYAFLDDIRPSAPLRHRRRAAATIARLSDLDASP